MLTFQHTLWHTQLLWLSYVLWFVAVGVCSEAMTGAIKTSRGHALHGAHILLPGKRLGDHCDESPAAKRWKFQEECKAKLRFATQALRVKEEPFEQVLALDGDLCKVGNPSPARRVGASPPFFSVAPFPRQ